MFSSLGECIVCYMVNSFMQIVLQWVSYQLCIIKAKQNNYFIQMFNGKLEVRLCTLSGAKH